MYRVNCLLLLLILIGCERTGSVWSDEEKVLMASLSLESLADLPQSVSNRVADNPQAVAFGQKLFFDKALSSTGEISCASCHVPDLGFVDGLAKARGVSQLTRNTPSLLGVAWSEWLYWDGRKDSLWSQALAPLEAPAEMGSSRMEVVRVIGNSADYRRRYTELFGEFPFSLLSGRLPVSASPIGSPDARTAWFGLSAQQRLQVNRVFSNAGKAIEAFERTLHFKNSPFDQFVAELMRDNYKAAEKLLSRDAIAGLKLFLDESRTGCLRCHNGPLFTNNHFHNIGTGRFEGEELDIGRFLGIQTVLLDEFNCLGQFSDANRDQCFALRFLDRQIDGEMQGAYKTPSLRNLRYTAPYFHDGRFYSIAEVLNHYQASIPEDAEIDNIELTDQEAMQLVEFLESLSSPPPVTSGS